MVDGRVSPPQELFGRTSESITMINLQQRLEAKLQKIDYLLAASENLTDNLLSYQKEQFEEASTSQTRRFDQIEEELKKLGGDFQATKFEVETMTSSLATLTEIVMKDSQIISTIKTITLAIYKEITSYEKDNEKRHNATMKKLDFLVGGTTFSSKPERGKRN